MPLILLLNIRVSAIAPGDIAEQCSLVWLERVSRVEGQRVRVLVHNI